MALPRMVVPGGSYLVTRTTSDRRFLLKPGLVDDIFLYCLFRAAEEHGVLLHQLTIESTHFHLVCTDTRGELSEFVTWLDRHVALCLLEHYRGQHPERTLEGIWSRGSFNATLLASEEAIVEAIVYSATGPVKDGLVPNLASFPGICTGPEQWLREPTTVKRPALYFRGGRPERATARGRFTAPPQLGTATRALVQGVRQRIGERLRSIAGERAGKGSLGRRALLQQDPFDAPRNPRPSGTRTPTVKAAGDRERYALAREAVRAFREAYRIALDKFRSGVTRALFPAGTLMMRRRFAVRCAADDFFWCCRAPAPA
jgi:REP element-mobilizing transposase RayT